MISLPALISLLVGTVANNGNLLLNIGPKADGTIPEEQAKRLIALGKWLDINGEGIYGTRCSSRVSENRDDKVQIHYTKKEKDLYVFIDGLKEGKNQILLSNVHGEVVSMNPELEIVNEMTENGLLLTVKNYRADMYVAGFKGENLE